MWKIFNGALAPGVLGLAMLAPLSASAATVVASADSYITVHDGLGGANSNHGADQSLWEIGSGGFQTFPLLKFDLSAHAGQSVAGPGVLTLTAVSTWSGQPVGQTIDLNTSPVAWDESTVTWNSFGANFGSTIDSEIFTPVVIGDTVSFSVPKAVIQGWIDNPSNNFGVVLVSTTLSLHQDLIFASRENGTGQPTLSFRTNSAVPEPAAWTLFLAGFGAVGWTLRARREARSPRPA